MEIDPYGKPPSLPERREDLCITSIVVPADDSQPLGQHQLQPSALDEYRLLVGGDVELVNLESPPACMYVNELGKLLGMPTNQRATKLLWMHNRAFRYRELLVGDTMIVGALDEAGDDSTVPQEYLQTLFAARALRFDVQIAGDDQWHTHQRCFDNWLEAYDFALGWALGPDNAQKSWIRDIRVAPEPEQI